MSRRSMACLLFVFVLLSIQLGAGCPSLLGVAFSGDQTAAAVSVGGTSPPPRDLSVATSALPPSASPRDVVCPSAPSMLLWTRTYGTGLDDFGWGLANCSDGGYALVGSTDGFGAGGLDIWLVRTDAHGNMLWNRTYGGPQDEEGAQVIQLDDGGFIIAGSSRSFGVGDLDAWLIRTDASGDVLWNRTYGGTLDDAAYEAVPCRSGGFAVTGFTNSLGKQGSSDVWLIRTDELGNPLWNRTFGGAQEDACWSIAECSSDGFILGGMTKSAGAGDMDFLLIRTNETGYQAWNQTWGGLLEDWGVCAVECQSGGFALAGSTYSFGAGDRDGWLIRTDTNGQQLWNRTYGGPVKDSVRWVTECATGGFVLAGDTYSYGAGGSDMWLVRTGEDGSEAWNEAAGGGLNDYGRAVVEAKDGHLAMVGIAYGLGAGSWDVFLACFGMSNWTIMVYMDADNDLEEYAFDDLNSMELVGSTPRMSVIVLVDFWDGTYAPFTGAKCYRIAQDLDEDVIASPVLTSPLPSEPNMADWQTLRDFIVFAQSCAPADRYLLTIWDHGEGFYGVCVDETSGYAMGIDELGQALSGALTRIDIVAFDACMMAQLEVAYQLRDSTDVLVFSEAGIPLTGFPYEDILDTIDRHNPGTPEQVADLMVRNYTQAYGPGGRYSSQGRTDICLSAVHTGELDAVEEFLDQLAGVAMQSWFLDSYFDSLCQARADTQSFDRPDFMDLGDFANHTADWLPGTTAQTIAEWLRTQLYYAVFSESHLEGLPGATGLGLSFADTVERYSYLLNLTIGKCRWYDFMIDFASVGRAMYGAPPLNNGTRCGYLDGPDDRFFFALTPPVSGYYRVTMHHAWDGYDDDFDLYLLSESQDTLASSTSPESHETFEVLLFEGTTYYIMVESWSGSSILYGLGVFYVTANLQWVTTGSVDWVFMLLGELVAMIGVFIVLIVIIYAAVRHDRTRRAYRPVYVGAPSAGQEEIRPPSATPLRPGVAPFCPFCGAPLAPDDAFCYSCGSRIPRR